MMSQTKLIHLLIIMVLTLSLSQCECKSTQLCGSFSFSGTSNDGADLNSLPMSLTFDFNPADCGSRCTCNPVCYIQMVRNYDIDDGNYLYPSTEKQQRATANGWYIDRIPGRIWGYYGRNDNGTFAGNLQPGSESVNTILFDEPSRPDNEPWLNFWWQAVSATVCIQAGSDCKNRLLGYYFWSWRVDAEGHIPAQFNAKAWKNLDQEFQLAVGAWNSQAPTLGKNAFPSLTDL